MDEDCWGYRCDRRRGACIIPMVDKHKLFIECIIDITDIITARVLAEKYASLYYAIVFAYPYGVVITILALLR